MSPESSSLRPRRLASFTALLAVMLVLLMIGVYKDLELMEVVSPDSAAEKSFMMNIKNKAPSLTHRKLFNHPAKETKEGKANSNSRAKGKMNVVEPNRIWSEKCSESDIVISQGATEPLPNGIPTYTVEIMNVCTSGCNISAVHLSCGWFSSARLINPRVFKRLDYDDCLVNDGKPIANGRTLSFQYANTFRYPLSVSSVTC